MEPRSSGLNRPPKVKLITRKGGKSKHESEEATKHAMIITCMDARIDPLEWGDFHEGQVYVARNGGGRVSDDMIRSAVLAISAFKVDTVFIVHHTDCGLEKISDQEKRHRLHKSLGPSQLGEPVTHEKHNSDRYRQADYVSFLAFKNLEESVFDDVFRFRNSPLVSEKVSVSGYVYDVDTHELSEVREP